MWCDSGTRSFCRCLIRTACWLVLKSDRRRVKPRCNILVCVYWSESADAHYSVCDAWLPSAKIFRLFSPNRKILQSPRYFSIPKSRPDSVTHCLWVTNIFWSEMIFFQARLGIATIITDCSIYEFCLFTNYFLITVEDENLAPWSNWPTRWVIGMSHRFFWVRF